MTWEMERQDWIKNETDYDSGYTEPSITHKERKRGKYKEAQHDTESQSVKICPNTERGNDKEYPREYLRRSDQYYPRSG